MRFVSEVCREKCGVEYGYFEKKYRIFLRNFFCKQFHSNSGRKLQQLLPYLLRLPGLPLAVDVLREFHCVIRNAALLSGPIAQL